MRKNKFIITCCLLLSLVTIGCSGSAGKTSNAPADTTAQEKSSQEDTAQKDTSQKDTAQADTTQEDTTQVETTQTETTQTENAQTKLTYIGHASVKLVAQDGTVIYIDPNYKNDYVDEADILLVTHAHDDHRPHANVKVKDGGTTITYEEALHDGVYESYDIGNIHIETVAAGGNKNHSITCCVGYVITIDGIKVYHAGDTSMIDQMADLSDKGIDYAMYPIDGMYNMDAVEATSVANLVAAKHNIPIHELDYDNTGKADNFTPEGRMVLSYGEEITLTK